MEEEQQEVEEEEHLPWPSSSSTPSSPRLPSSSLTDSMYATCTTGVTLTAVFFLRIIQINQHF